ncbi:hypothetical protein AMECASPLE_037142, partial [Ameca splendens]
EAIRPVNVMAVGEVTCLVIDRRTFRDVIEGSGSDSPPELQQSNESKVEPKEDPACLASYTISDFQIIRTLGVGEFSHVDLVQLKGNIRCVFAMRVLKKKLILNSGQREHILRERSILMEARCPFIVRYLSFSNNLQCLPKVFKPFKPFHTFSQYNHKPQFTGMFWDRPTQNCT